MILPTKIHFSKQNFTNSIQYGNICLLGGITMSKSKRGLSLEELGEEYAKKIKASLKKLELFHSYGVNISEEDLENYEVLKTSRSEFKYLDKSTGEITTVDLISHIFKKLLSGIGKTTIDPSRGLTVEKFYKRVAGLRPETTSTEENIVLRRAYIDVPTKYGNFCFQIEYDKCRDFKNISLYKGFKEECFVPVDNDFDFHNCCIFRVKHIDDTDFDMWNVGYSQGQFEGPNLYGCSRWNNIIADGHGKRIIQTRSYCFSNRKSNDNAIILLDGAIKLSEFEEKQDFFDYTRDIVEEYENRRCTSKAYFANPGECLAIIKNGEIISVEYKRKQWETDSWIKDVKLSLLSQTDGAFTIDDFQKAIELLDLIDIDARMRQFAISGLAGFINTHDVEMNVRDEMSLKNNDFASFVETLKSDKLTEIVEYMLERLTETFNMSVEDILGENPITPKKVSTGKRFLPIGNQKHQS